MVSAWLQPAQSNYRLSKRRWASSCVHTECTLHQLSPYIGKLKSTIARQLIQSFSQEGDLVVDPFAGAGTVPFEAVLANRRVFASDVSRYSEILTKGKLGAPSSIEEAFDQTKAAFTEAAQVPIPSLANVPRWVRSFFHPETLKEVIRFATVCRKPGREFLFSCLLGILHHQRPGFLSFPSSHLVPYLRDNIFPKNRFPELYEYRELQPRLMAKIERAFRRHALPRNAEWQFRRANVENVTLPLKFDAVVTSPPYMNALDYVRDNRLRLWLINPGTTPRDDDCTRRKSAFQRAMSILARKIDSGLTVGGHAVFIVGEKASRAADHPAVFVKNAIALAAPHLHLIECVSDEIPDIRRSRRECRGTKAEQILVYRK